MAKLGFFEGDGRLACLDIFHRDGVIEGIAFIKSQFLIANHRFIKAAKEESATAF